MGWSRVVASPDWPKGNWSWMRGCESAVKAKREGDSVEREKRKGGENCESESGTRNSSDAHRARTVIQLAASRRRWRIVDCRFFCFLWHHIALVWIERRAAHRASCFRFFRDTYTFYVQTFYRRVYARTRSQAALQSHRLLRNETDTHVLLENRIYLRGIYSMKYIEAG